MKRKKPKQKLTKTRILWFAAMLTAVAVLLFSTGQLIKIYWEYEVGTSEYDALQQYVERAPEPTKQPPKDDKVSEPQDSEATPAPVEEEPAYLPPQVDFEALKAINPDIVGWIEIEAIPSISYPIVKGMDNDKYLHTTFENTKNSAGAIFMDYTNASNFTDCNTLIYGHNMKNGSMFGLLKNLRDKELYKESPYFWICTPEGNFRYEIFSAHVAGETSDTYTLFYDHNEAFEKYLEKMRSITEIPVTKVPKKEDKIVTLSTCTSNATQRFVVQGVPVE